jgi:hypothetical protein
VGVVGSNPATTGNGWGMLGFSTPDRGGVFGTGANGVVGCEVQSNGAVAGQPGLSVFGTFTASGTKNFIQPHPNDPSKTIEYVCLEGGEAGTYWRGTAQLVDGEAVVEMPEHFRVITAGHDVTAQVTPLGPGMLYVAERTNRRIVVRAMPGSPPDTSFDYFVQGLRLGFENHVPLRPVKPSDIPTKIRPELWQTRAKRAQGK